MLTTQRFAPEGQTAGIRDKAVEGEGEESKGEVRKEARERGKGVVGNLRVT